MKSSFDKKFALILLIAVVVVVTSIIWLGNNSPRGYEILTTITDTINRFLWIVMILVAPWFMFLLIRAVFYGKRLTYKGELIERHSFTHYLTLLFLLMMGLVMPLAGIVVTYQWLKPLLGL